MNKYTILLSSDSLKESLAEELNKLKNDDSVINKEDEICVITDYKEMTDFDVYVGIGDIAEETFMCLQENMKPTLLCDIDCSMLDGLIATEEDHSQLMEQREQKPTDGAARGEAKLAWAIPSRDRGRQSQPMEQREERPSLIGLSRVVTKEEKVNLHYIMRPMVYRINTHDVLSPASSVDTKE